MTIEEYNEKIVKKFGSQDFIVFQAPNVISNRDKITVKCTRCGTLKEVTARNFIRMNGEERQLKREVCEKCKENKKIEEENLKIEKQKEREENKPTKEKLEKRLKNFEVLEIVKYPTLKVRCKLCGAIFEGAFHNLLNSKKCKFCSNRVKFTEEEAQKFSDEKFGKNKYKIERIFSKQYKTCKKNFVDVSYNGKIFTKSLSEFMRYGFEREIRRNLEYYDNIVSNATDGRIRIPLDQEYKGADKEYLFEDVKKKVRKWFKLKDFVYNGCNFYSNNFSSYARTVFAILNKSHIFFTKEKSFYGVGKRRFDIELKDEKLIEIDGLQHFKEIFCEGQLAKTKESDKIKNEFCVKTKKCLLRLPYTVFEQKERKNELKNIISSYINNDFESLKKYKFILFIHDGVIENEDSYVPFNSDID